MTETIQKMRKLNSSIDIIPIQGVSNEDAPKVIGKRKHEGKQPNKQHNHVHRDPLIITRVQDYLYENEDKVYIDVTEMADCLMKKYRDYRTKKRGPFRLMVRRAYDEITESFSKKSDNQSKQDDDEDEDDDDIIQSDSEIPDTDVLGNELLRMYKRSKMEEQNGNSDKELIDISSDDDAAEVEDIAPEKISHTQFSTISPTKLTKNSKHNCSAIKMSLHVPTKQTNNDTCVESKKFEEPKPKIGVEKGRKRPRERGTDNSMFSFAKKRTEGTFGTKVQEKRFKFSDIGGNTKVLETVCRLLIHMKHPEIFKQLGISPPRGFLLHGPPGCGKSLMAHAIAGQLDVPFLRIAAPELVAGVSGESESRIRELFEQATALAPCVLFLDEIDALAPSRANAQKEMERRIVAQLLSCLDELSLKENGDKVLVLGATNRPDAIDPALRRAGRFDREVCLGIPDKECRVKILEVHSANLSLADDVEMTKIAALSPGFVGADLVSLLREAASAAIDRVFKGFKAEENSQREEMEASKAVAASEKAKNPEEENSEAKNSEEMISEDSEDKEAESTTGNDEVPEKKSEVSSVDKEDNTNLPQSSTNDPVIPAKTEVNNISELERLVEMLNNESEIPPEHLAKLRIENIDFEVALKVVQPSSKREGFATVPDVTWDDIGSLQEIREELQMAILAPVKYAEDFATFGLTMPTGVLLCGPPGCGKTLLAKAIANEAEINFISVKGPELLNMYVGESEKAVRQCFIRARNSAPCVIFFDELDALCPKRTEGDNSSTSRVVNQVLTEMDGVEGRKGVYLMAATNRPDIIDPAVMRPGRFDKILYVGLPTPTDRVDILKALTKNGTKPKFSEDASLEIIGMSDRCDGYTGADLAGLIREAGIAALKESMADSSGLTEVHMRHVETAFNKVRPSVQEKDARHYEKLRKQYTVQGSKVVKSSTVSPDDTSSGKCTET